MSAQRLAYLFERFPSFTQTFCQREVSEMFRLRVNPLVCSIRAPKDSTESEPFNFAPVLYFPAGEELIPPMRKRRLENTLSRHALRALYNWHGKRDKNRVYEAEWLGPLLRERGVRHVHVHFAGIAARTAYWMKKCHGISYSFTGHANDVFCKTDYPVSLQDLVGDAKFVVMVSDYGVRWMQEQFPEHAQKVHRIYNAIELEQFKPATEVRDGVPQILAVGRYIEKKGFSDLIEACRLLNEKGVSYSCLIVGGGPLHNELQLQVENAGLTGTVVLTGPLPQTEVRKLLASSDIFALPCVTERDGGMDNLPTVIMEAMASALPVVSTQVAGVPEMVEHGQSGLLVPEQQPMALAGALISLLQNKQQRQTFGTVGRRLAEERFAVEKTVPRLRDLLQQAEQPTLLERVLGSFR